MAAEPVVAGVVVHDGACDDVRDYVIEQLDDPDAILVDETGD